MEAKELMLGNWINYKGFDVQITIEDFAEFDKNLLHIAKPIPITEVWLFNFGFEYWVSINDHLAGVNPLIMNKNDFEIKVVFGVTVNGKLILLINEVVSHNVQYVHQLQNLYFALTGEELTINK